MFFCLSNFVMKIFEKFLEIPLSQKFHNIRDFPNFKADSRAFITRVGFDMGFVRDPESQIPIPGIQDRNFLFWAESKNPENSGIPGIGI